MNSVQLVGNLTRDPEYGTSQNGIAYCKFTVACQRRFANAQGVREADFISCVAWRQTADFVQRYFIKGNKIGLTGTIQTGSYTGQDGQKRYTTDVIVDNVEFVAPRQDSGQRPSYGDNGPTPPPQYGGGQPAPHNAAPAPRAPATNEFTEVDDDELPF